MLSIYIFYCMLFAQPVKDNIKKILFFYPLFFHPIIAENQKIAVWYQTATSLFSKNSSYILTDNNSYIATKSKQTPPASCSGVQLLSARPSITLPPNLLIQLCLAILCARCTLRYKSAGWINAPKCASVWLALFYFIKIITNVRSKNNENELQTVTGRTPRRVHLAQSMTRHSCINKFGGYAFTA